jgi:RES domain-containing protein
MIFWRISNYADLSGQGGLYAPGRWHNQGIPVVYCGDHPGSALLEILVHVDLSDIPTSFQLL